MNSPEHLILLLIGTLQVIAIGLISWTLNTIVKMLQRMSNLEGKFDAFPIQQINNNRHRLEGLERHQETVLIRLTTLEQVVNGIKAFCNSKHGGNL